MLNPNIVKLNGVLGYAHKTNKGYVFQELTKRSWNSESDPVYEFDQFETTTKVEQIKYLEQKFVWGNVLDVHEYGDFLIFEYKKRGTNNILYHIYYSYSDTNISAYSLDQAIIEALAYKYEENASKYIYRILGMNKETK